MTAKKIKDTIASCLNDVIMEYHGDTIFVNPWNDNKFEFAYKDIDKTYTSIEDLMSDKIYDGKSLKEIAAEVTLM
ncbi:MAG: hypothetical protein Q4F95_00830 [Oscillospiraceae bacterium]|nr:hypothetical protein [Oscillospiraceae bacterium]